VADEERPASPRKARALSAKQIRYNIVIEALFAKLRTLHGPVGEMDYSGKELRDLIAELLKSKQLDADVGNVPDIKYTFDARRDFPAAIAGDGYWAIVGRGKGKYRFVRMPHRNLISLATDLPVAIEENRKKTDETPRIVRMVLGNDEQATMARVRWNHLVRDFTGLQTVYQLQGHERTTVSAGQIEIDEAYIGEDASGNTYLMPLSAKGGNDMLSYTQALNLNLYVSDNSNQHHREWRRRRYHGLLWRALGAVAEGPRSVVLIEFSNETDVRKIQVLKARRYTFDPVGPETP
jgi:hypothetical protein